ncbi:hypothetical protein CJF30_00000578 [Rutstroemia sp. NJR-2017a BBW]|nr:hypothetical protein CJF30_00000578 [Rutstroemia sp. NJR-2017a BBW]
MGSHSAFGEEGNIVKIVDGIRAEDLENSQARTNENGLYQIASNTSTVEELPHNYDELTTMEKKSFLVTRELNRMGMGRYQWSIWVLCGLGYFLDLVWAHAFGLIAPAMQKEFGFSDQKLGLLFTAVNTGLTAGALIWGVLVDVIGRKWAFNGTVLVCSSFGILIAAPSSYPAILALVAFTGFGIGGNIPIDTTIALEFLPENKRFLLALLSIFQPVGVVVCSGIAYGFIPPYSCAEDLQSCATSDLAPGAPCCSRENNQGWRYLLFTLGGLSFFIFTLRFFVFRLQESPKFLLSKGKDKEAIKVLQVIAKTNKTTCHLTNEDFAELDFNEELRSPATNNSGDTRLRGGKSYNYATMKDKLMCELKRTGTLFATRKLARVTILVWVIYAFDYFGFSIAASAGAYLPTILARKGAAHHATTAETYRNFVIIYLPGVVGVTLGGFMTKVPRVGRRWSMVVSSALMATSLFLYAAIDTQAANIGITAMEYFFQSMFNSVLYGWTPEAFPAPVRGTASGMASCWGRLFSIFSPMIAARILEKSLNGVLFLAGAGTFVATLGILGLPNSVMNGDEL